MLKESSCSYNAIEELSELTRRVLPSAGSGKGEAKAEVSGEARGARDSKEGADTAEQPATAATTTAEMDVAADKLAGELSRLQKQSAPLAAMLEEMEVAIVSQKRAAEQVGVFSSLVLASPSLGLCPRLTLPSVSPRPAARFVSAAGACFRQALGG